MANSVKAAVVKSDSVESVDKTPYMSEYDKSIEPRLKALEDQVYISSKSNGSTAVDEDKLTALEAKIDDLIKRLSAKMSF